MKKSSIKNLVRNYSNILTRATKSIDKKVISIEVLEHCQKLKVDRISLV